MASGASLAIETVDSHPSDVLHLLAGATTAMFQGPSIEKIEAAFRRARGIDVNPRKSFQEIVILGDYLVHVFIRLQSDQDRVVCFACRKTSKLEELMERTRDAARRLDEFLKSE